MIELNSFADRLVVTGSESVKCAAWMDQNSSMVPSVQTLTTYFTPQYLSFVDKSAFHLSNTIFP